MFFRRFLDAIEDCRSVRKRPGVLPVYASLASCASKFLASAQRFYVPAIYDVIEGKVIDWNLIRLPFQTIALLSECMVEEGSVPDTLLITIATNAGNLNSYGPVMRIAEDVDLDRAIALMSVVLTPGAGWILQPGIGWIQAPFAGSDGYTINASVIAGLQGMGAVDMLKEVHVDANHVLNLCTMLSLHNVKTREQQPSESLAKSRKIRDKAPLPNYHVIVVDGEVWDRPQAKTDAEHLTRSHMRRGHIRRLDEARRVWVRSTYVHGRLPGFVDKEYKLEPHL